MEINTFEKIYGKDQFICHERMLASEDISGSFLQTSFIEKGDVITAIYRYEGYLKVSECRFRNQKQLLNLIERVIGQIKHASDYYVSADRLEISADTVFYRVDDEDVRMAFVLSEGGDFKKSLIAFCNELTDRFSNGSTEGIDMLISFLTTMAAGFEDMKAEIERIKRLIDE